MTDHPNRSAESCDLKPCPFCGGSAEIEVGCHNFNDAQVRCTSCGLYGPDFDDDALIGGDSTDPKADAAAHWNSRIPTVAQSSQVRLATVEECARIAEAQAQEFLSPEYASNQPLGSFCERFACAEVAKSIRALAAQPIECGDCPPAGYPDKERCAPCPQRLSAGNVDAREALAKVIQSHVMLRSRGGRSMEIFGFEEAADAILRMRVEPQSVAWRPIETAPRDGSRILLFQHGRGAFEGWWKNDWPVIEQYWMDDADSEPSPTHWQPTLALPRPTSQCADATSQHPSHQLGTENG